jgi:hypothetical protein
MKILIGYDGSEGADVGLEGSRRAGLPPRDVEALVVTVAARAHCSVEVVRG